MIIALLCNLAEVARYTPINIQCAGISCCLRFVLHAALFEDAFCPLDVKLIGIVARIRDAQLLQHLEDRWANGRHRPRVSISADNGKMICNAPRGTVGCQSPRIVLGQLRSKLSQTIC